MLLTLSLPRQGPGLRRSSSRANTSVQQSLSRRKTAILTPYQEGENPTGVAMLHSISIQF